jgi:hypothetical protein
MLISVLFSRFLSFPDDKAALSAGQQAVE